MRVAFDLLNLCLIGGYLLTQTLQLGPFLLLR